MSFRRRIIPKNYSIDVITTECTPNLSPPTNIQGVPQDKGESLLLSWESPKLGDLVYSYDLLLDGNVIESDIRNNSFLYKSIDFGVNYNFTVKAKGECDQSSQASQPFAWVGGGLPVMNPVLQPGYLSATLLWFEVEDNVDYDIEGYNVYFKDDTDTWVKQNSNLLDTLTTLYLKENLGLEEFVEMAVTFEYNGGTESQMFKASGTTHPGPGGSYRISLNSSVYYPLVNIRDAGMFTRGWGAGWFSVGIGLKENSSVFVVPSIPRNFGRYYKNIGFFHNNSQDGYAAFYRILFSESEESVYGLYEGCQGAQGGFNNGFIENGISPFKTDNLDHKISGGIRPTGFSIISGNCFSQSTISMDFYVSFDPNSLIEIKYANPTYYSISEFPNPEPLVQVNVVGNDAQCSWNSKPGADGYNIYLRETSEEVYTKQNNELITGTNYTINNLSSGTYLVLVTLVKNSYNYETNLNDVNNIAQFTV